MSLKAKIEAVIYASEEPVTLAQLMGLLGHEAQAELDHLDSAQQTLALDTDSAVDDSPYPSPEAQHPGASEVQSDTEPTRAEPTEPEPTDSAPAKEPDPLESSPIPSLKLRWGRRSEF